MKGRFVLAMALAVGSMACGGAGEQDIVGPSLSAACVVDRIAVGESLPITIGAGTGCLRPRYYEPYGRDILDSVANQIDSGSVSGVEIHLVAGRSYQFTAVADGVPAETPVAGPSLTLYGPSPDTSETGFIAVSTSEGPALNPSLIFVAPATGTYVIALELGAGRASATVQLTTRGCANLGVLASDGTLRARTIDASSCTAYGYGYRNEQIDDTSRVGILQIRFAADAAKLITVTSRTPGYRPVFHIGGRGADTYDYLVRRLFASFIGNATAAEGVFRVLRAGDYTVIIDNAPLAGTTVFDISVRSVNP